MAKPNKTAFKRVCEELETGAQFTMNMAMDVFGNQFSEMFILCLMDAQDAARAIQGSINRLRMGDDTEDDEDADLDEVATGTKEPS